jgi:hypothetical protein
MMVSRTAETCSFLYYYKTVLCIDWLIVNKTEMTYIKIINKLFNFVESAQNV